MRMWRAGQPVLHSRKCAPIPVLFNRRHMDNATHWNLLTSDQLRALQPAEQFTKLAEAFLDSAQHLCNDLVTRPEGATYERGSVVLYLAAHAVELFLKGAISRKAPKECFAHDLEHIHKRYRALYPAKRFAMTEMPFRSEFPQGMSAAEIAKLKQGQPDPSELFRYPLNKSSEPWHGVHGFEAGSFSTVLATLRADFTRILAEL